MSSRRSWTTAPRRFALSSTIFRDSSNIRFCAAQSAIFFSVTERERSHLPYHIHREGERGETSHEPHTAFLISQSSAPFATNVSSFRFWSSSSVRYNLCSLHNLKCKTQCFSFFSSSSWGMRNGEPEVADIPSGGTRLDFKLAAYNCEVAHRWDCAGGGRSGYPSVIAWLGYHRASIQWRMSS